jgi:DNA-binding MarR family transcriptional regulator
MSKDPLSKWISILYRHSMMHAKEFLKEYDINAGQIPFFMNIVKSPGITQDELSRKLHIDKSTTAKAVKTLIDKGYVTKNIYQQDKRMYKLFPTEKANTVKEIILKIAFKWDRDVLLKGFSEEEKRQTYKILNRMAENCINYFEKK